MPIKIKKFEEIVRETGVFQSWECKMQIFYCPFGSIMLSTGEKSKEVFVSNFYVSKRYRRRGLGTYLLKRAIAWSKENKYKAMRLQPESPNGETVKLKRYYAKFGFKEVFDCNYDCMKLIL